MQSVKEGANGGVSGCNGDTPPSVSSHFIPSEAQAKACQEFMDAKKAAAWLGVPLRSLRLYVQQGLLPSYKLGRHRLFRKEELLRALDAHRLTIWSEILR
jgi:excisionase family DNA binding protein